MGLRTGKNHKTLTFSLEQSEIYGTDYNSQTISWNKNNIKNIFFNCNSLEAKLPYEDAFFDVIYGISIFTHLSEDLHKQWFDELQRILKPGGLLILTLQGEAFQSILSNEEKRKFAKGELVVRGNVQEGHRVYSAFHPEIFVRNLCSQNEILEHHPSFFSGKNRHQDVWVIRK